MNKGLLLSIFLFIFGINTILYAKEITLKLKRDSLFNISLHYKISSINAFKDIYAQGDLSLNNNTQTNYIYVNRLSNNDNLLIQIDKISIYNRIVFNDPCEISLNKDESIANITVGFKGNPKLHGSFTCLLAKN